MIPGKFSICLVTIENSDSDSSTFKTLQWGFDSEEQCFSVIKEVADENNVNVDDCCVIKLIEQDES